MKPVKIVASVLDNSITIYSAKSLSNVFVKELSSCNIIEENGVFVYTMPLLLYNSFVTLHFYNKHNKHIEIDAESLETIQAFASRVTDPSAFIQGGTWVGMNVPSIPCYTQLMQIMGAKNNRLTLYTVPFGRLYEVYRFLHTWEHSFLPKIKIDKPLMDKMEEALSDNPTLEDLFSVDLYDLTSIKNGWQIKSDGFKKLKYETAVDLLLKKPNYYQDRTETYGFYNAPFGKAVFIEGVIESFSATLNKNCEMKLLDKNGISQQITFWGQAYLTGVYHVGDNVVVQCTRLGRNFSGMAIFSDLEVKALPVAPVYNQSPRAKINIKVITNSVQELLLRYHGSELCNYIPDLPCTLWESLHRLHFPKNSIEFEETINTLAFIEMVFLQLMFLHQKELTKQVPGVSKVSKEKKLLKESLSVLPFDLTKGQKDAVNEVIRRLGSQSSEKMLLSGDVGTGKSLVANSACLYTVDCGYQAAILAPTEILAQQLYNGLMQQVNLMTHKPNVAYLSGKTKAKEKREIELLLKTGHIDIIVGTHSLLNVEYKNLGLLVIDEQQKFGRSQREKLESSLNNGKGIDILEQTATPIPQTTALAFYGNTDLIPLKEKPAGRKENITKWVKQSSDDFLKALTNPTWEHIYQEIEQGHQVFVVTPSVNDTKRSASVEKTTKILQNKFPNLIIDYIHGQMSKDEQNKKIEKFRVNTTNVLIASSIVEVGINIPNATIMLVLDANYFGASSLHQIRGRVGRGELQGYCYLVADATTANAEKRLQSLVDSNDGFDIAMVDLETRKEGNLFGEQQSGVSHLKFCDLVNHSDKIEKAQQVARDLYNSKYKDIALKDAQIFLKTELEED